MSPLRALRLRCVDCCTGSVQEVRLCAAVACPSWPFRMGKNPWRAARALSEAQRATLAKMHAARRGSGAEEEDDDDPMGLD